MNHPALRGRVALVTGGSRGIGRGIALKLAAAGADIAVNYNRDEAAALEVVAESRALGVRAEAFQGSVQGWEDCARVVDQTVAAFGSIGMLINNAGIGSRGNTVADTEPAEMERVIAVNAFGAFYMTKLALPYLRKQPRSDVIFISTVGTAIFGPRGAPYTMAKAAMEAMAKTLAKEERQHGVRVNIVAPSLTVTEMGSRLSRATRGVSDIHELDAQSPFGRVSTPQDIASLVAYLVSEENFYISGQRIAVDGGAGG